MTFAPTIRTDADLERAWRTLMGPLGFSRHSLWVMVVADDGVPLPQLTKIDDLTHPPERDRLTALAERLRGHLDDVAPRGRVAFLLSRPGRGGLTPRDRAWAAALYAFPHLADVPVMLVHRACDADLVPVPLDDALPTSA